MEEHFEDRLSTLMDYRTEPISPFTAADLAAAAGNRHRSHLRFTGLTVSALTVAAIGVAVATLAGGQSASASGPAVNAAAGGGYSAKPAATSASASAAGKVSPVINVKSGELIQILPGAQMNVTATTKCVYYSGAITIDGGCKDVTDPNMAYDGTPSIGIQGGGNTETQVITGVYQGPSAPALIEVVSNGKHYTATIVKTVGMVNWVGYYATFPTQLRVLTPSTVDPLGFTVYAYDADGHLITQNPPVTTTKK